jgi:hypothetical protein
MSLTLSRPCWRCSPSGEPNGEHGAWQLLAAGAPLSPFTPELLTPELLTPELLTPEPFALFFAPELVALQMSALRISSALEGERGA